MRVFVTGGTGFIGKAVAAALCARGDSVAVLSRDSARARAALPRGVDLVVGDPTCAGSWQERVRACDAAVHLAGEPVSGRRWNAQFRQLIHDSRVESTRYLVEAIAAAPLGERPRVLVCASGIDYYPSADDIEAHTAATAEDPVDESSAPGGSFLARVCRDWEAEAREAERSELRVVMMRTGLVLGGGGPLDKMIQPFRFYLGGPLGNGRQWTTWIHIEDTVRAYLFALDKEALRGPVNLVAPAPVRNRDFARALGRALRRPSWLPVPARAIRLAIGEFAEYALQGRRAVPRRLLDAGFEFLYPDVDSALHSLDL
jgi:uncharacterized protein (TIGR01777 family)